MAQADRERAAGHKIVLGPLPNDALLGQGTTSFLKREYDQAILDFSEVLRIDPQQGTAYLMRGRARLAKKEYDRAIAYFYEVLRINPGDPSAYYYRSHAYEGKADADRNRAAQLDGRLPPPGRASVRRIPAEKR
jgi:tetratricopeptide (TPR) repeat protein